MRILWLSMVGSQYNGIGWMQSLLDLLRDSGNDIALAFLSTREKERRVDGNVTYYPIEKRHNTFWRKITEHYGGYRRCGGEAYLCKIKEVISDFNPDVIHVFGFETPLCDILGNTQVPVIVHLQGLLTQIDNAFFPNGFNKRTFVFPPTTDELILNKGFIYDKNKTHAMAVREAELMKKARYVTGRTDWDRKITQLLAPQAKYFHIDEVLRPVFYKNAGKWQKQNSIFTIVSTLSQVLYKGLDTILKTADILKKHSTIDFRWEVVGIEPNSYITRVMEKKTRIKSGEVNISYQGIKKEEELCELLLHADAYIHTSYIDNSPNSLCEAQILGLPTVSTNVGGITTLIKDDETGLLVPANDPYQIASIIKQMYSDRAVCEKLSHNGTKAALKRHDKSVILNSVLDAYSSMIRDNR